MKDRKVIEYREVGNVNLKKKRLRKIKKIKKKI